MGLERIAIQFTPHFLIGRCRHGPAYLLLKNRSITESTGVLELRDEYVFIYTHLAIAADQSFHHRRVSTWDSFLTEASM